VGHPPKRNAALFIPVKIGEEPACSSASTCGKLEKAVEGMSEKLLHIVGELRRGLLALYGPRLANLVLFGSQARNEAEPESDIDVLVVLRGPVDPNQEIPRVSPLASGLSLKHDVVISCVYVSEEGFHSDQSPLLLNVRREGVMV
jgi:predicted nucleotidyltransferase